MVSQYQDATVAAESDKRLRQGQRSPIVGAVLTAKRVLKPIAAEAAPTETIAVEAAPTGVVVEPSGRLRVVRVFPVPGVAMG